MEKTATHYPAQQNIDLSNGSVIIVWLHCQVSTPTAISLARIINFMVIASRVWYWDSIFIICNDSSAGRCSLSKLHSLKWLSSHSHSEVPRCGYRWHKVMCEKLCAIASEDSIADSRRQAKNYKQWVGAWSILDILLLNANSSNFAYDGLYDGCFRCWLLLMYSG